MISPERRIEQRGFALLVVFLIAAAVAFTLYQQIPRVAFESERDKEELLIERGHEYQRAIQLYFVAYKKYPAKLEDLENTDQKRFLRRRYIDPMTGKNEWRLLHVNAAGQLTDSLVTKPPASPNSASSTQTLGAGQAGNTLTPGAGLAGAGIPGANTQGSNLGSTASANAGFNALSTPSANPAVPDPQTPNAAVLRRPSDRIPGAPTDTPAVDPNDPRTWPPIALFPANGNQQTGQTAQPGTLPQPGTVSANPFAQQQSQQIQGLPGQQIQGFPGAQRFPQQPFPASQQVQGNGQQFNQQQFPGQQFPGQQFPGQQFPGQTAVPGTTVLNPNGTPVTVGADGQLVPINSSQNGNFQNPAQNTSGFPAPGFNQNGFNQTGAGGTQPAGANSTPANFGFGGTGANTGAPTPFGAANAQNPALNAINNLLTTPAVSPTGAGSATMAAGGIAGVASTFKGSSIKVYKERTKYQEWEFIYEMKNAVTPGQGNANPLGTNSLNGSSSTNPLGLTNGTGAASPSPFGLPPTGGQSSPSPFGLPAPGGGSSSPSPFGLPTQ